MRRLCIYTLIIVAIPFLIVTLFDINKNEIVKLNYVSNKIIRVKRDKGGDIIYLPLEEYLVGVLAGEMPIYFEKEAFKAQAVAARSYAMKKMEYNKDLDYDVVDTVMNQVYLDDDYLKKVWNDKYTDNINKLREVVNETQNECLIYNNEIIDALFFSTSNGYTESSYLVFNNDIPYLVSVKSSWDEKTSSAFRSKLSFELNDFYDRLGLKYSETLNITNIKRSSTNRVISLSINNKEFSARTLYDKLGLKSTDFTISQDKNYVIFDMVGYGHGVGMSQYGAEGMALDGYNYIDILKYYYTGTELKKI